MPWQVAGRSMELCSCKMFCPCWLGPEGEPDEGWCSSAFGFDVRQGNADGVDLAGTRVVLIADWPGNFFGGGGKARLYIDEAADEEQRRELEGVFGGKKGGHLQALWDAVIDDWLPAQAAKVDIGWGEKPFVAVDGVGQATLQPLTDGAGRSTTVTGAVAQVGLQIESMNLASSKGSQWSDSELRRWQGNDGVLYEFDWSS